MPLAPEEIKNEMPGSRTGYLNVVCALAALMVGPQVVKANTLVATINGYYDVDGYDTPSLHIDNPTSFAFTNVTLTLTGYQGLNNGISQSIGLADIAAGTTPIFAWGSIPGADSSGVPGNLFAYDYDDEYNGHFSPATGFGLVALPNVLAAAPQCAPQSNLFGWNFCAQTGNFYVTFTAQWNGQSIYSQFSPDPTLPGAGNAAGVFVAWLGLDPNGWSETDFDSHSAGGPNGALADIFVGTPPAVGAPEPGSLALWGSGLLVLASKWRHKFRR